MTTIERTEKVIEQLDTLIDKYLNQTQSTYSELLNMKREMHRIKQEMMIYDNKEK